jgi:aspartyl-tRNA(Asn)/glutamyl-tRNA(Gln) amidotransferase subunit B
MNSFSGVERALEAEFARQCTVLDAGGRVQQQTMLWDAATGTVRPARTKEESHDYRYFPEPDLLPLVLAPDEIQQIRRAMPELPRARARRFERDYGLAEDDVELLTASPELAEYYEHVARAHGDHRAAANWVKGEVLAAVRTTGQDFAHFSVRPPDVAELLNLVRDGRISRTAAKQVFAAMIKTGKPPAEIVAREGLAKIDDADALTRWLDEVIAEHPAEAARFAKGERKLQGVFVGLVMRKSKGAADPKRLNQLLSDRFGK